ncbi:MAG TPA: hypothetical protein VFB84_16475 [Micromonosporaceae bacterium]|nr:hypothetical protein [Micromonosporaceae bacterium]
MRDEGDGGPPPAEVERRAAQDTAGELARMGIDPSMVGLDPVPAPDPPTPAHAPSGYRDDAAPAAAGAWSNVSGWSGFADGWPGSADGTTATAAGAPPATAGWPAPGGGYDPGGSPDPGGGAVAPAGWPAAAAAAPDGWSTHEEASTLSRPLGVTAAPDGSPVARYTDDVVGPLRQVADAYQVVLPARWHRGVRAVTFGLLQPGAAEAVEQERMLLARVRTRRREPCVVAFVAGKGGVGTTTTAGGVALTLATLRTDDTTLADAHHGAGSLAGRLGGPPAPTVTQLTDQEPGRPPVSPLRVRGVLGVVDGAPWHSPVPRARMVQALEKLRQENAFTLTDVGNDTSDSGHAALTQADHVVIVTTASQDAVESVRTALGRIRDTGPHRLGSLVIAVACLTARAHRRTARRLRAGLGLSAHRLVAVPFDPALAAGGRFEPAQLRAATREAFLRLAGYVADPGPEDHRLSLRAGIGDPLIDRGGPVHPDLPGHPDGQVHPGGWPVTPGGAGTSSGPGASGGPGGPASARR